MVGPKSLEDRIGRMLGRGSDSHSSTRWRSQSLTAVSSRSSARKAARITSLAEA
jgi:hypothetical protein